MKWFQVVKKSYQAQSRNLTQNSHFFNLDHPNQSQTTFMPYMEGPKINWTVNDGLYHWFLKWHLKCENILECEIAPLPEQQQCKKVNTCSGDFGMDQYALWCLLAEEVNLDTIWRKCEGFCKPQSSELRAHSDFLASFRQGNKSVDEWYNVVQVEINLVKHPPETGNILQRDIFWFFLHDRESVTKTINDGNVDLDKFQQVKLGSLQKEWKAQRQLHTISNRWLVTHKVCKSTYSGTSAQTCQQENTRKRSPLSSQDNQTTRIMVVRIPKCQARTRNGLMSRMPTRKRRGVQSGEVPPMWKAFSALQKSSSVKLFTILDTLPAFVIRKSKLHSSKGNQRCINYKQEQYMQKKVPYLVNLMITAQARIPFASGSKCSAHELISRRFQS